MICLYDKKKSIFGSCFQLKESEPYTVEFGFKFDENEKGNEDIPAVRINFRNFDMKNVSIGSNELQGANS